MRRLVLVLVLVTLPSCLSAQRMSAARFTAQPTGHGNGFVSRFGYAGFSQHRSHFYPFGFLPDPFFYNGLFSSTNPVDAQPPVVIMQAPTQAAADSTPDRFPSPADPLVIELRSGRYVPISGKASSEAEMIDQGPTGPLRPASPSDSATSARERGEIVPTTLVFRDGHREKVSDYTIADGVLYANGNYYTDGSWNRKIELTSLNLPETIKANSSSGTHFRLPTAPNEVIVGP